MKTKGILAIAAAAVLMAVAIKPSLANEPTVSAVQPPPDGTATVNAVLSDMHISVDRQSIPAGTVNFLVSNRGTVTHELVVLRTSLPADTIPADMGEPGKVSELWNIAETGDIAAGRFTGFAVVLPVGNYVLICNEPGHYLAGMRVAFTVTPPVVNVSLRDMTVNLDRSSVLAGPVVFSVQNAGSVLHELIVLKSDLPVDQIPADAAEPGKVSEDASLGEVGDIPAGRYSGNLIVLTPGRYVLICNEPGHYMAGMRTAFTVLPAPPEPSEDVPSGDSGGGD